MKIGILGSGNMGRHLGLLWAEQGHDVFFGNRGVEKAAAAAALAARPCGSGPLGDAAVFGEILLHTARDTMPSAMVSDRAALDGKILIDLNNTPVPKGFAFEPVLNSYAERFRDDSPGLRVVKAFNTIAMEMFEHCPDDIRAYDVSVFVAGDDADAKNVVTGLARELGFGAIDSGPLRNARLLESIADFYRYLVVHGGGGGIGLSSHISAQIIPEAAAPRLGGRARTELRSA